MRVNMPAEDSLRHYAGSSRNWAFSVSDDAIGGVAPARLGAALNAVVHASADGDRILEQSEDHRKGTRNDADAALEPVRVQVDGCIFRVTGLFDAEDGEPVVRGDFECRAPDAGMGVEHGRDAAGMPVVTYPVPASTPRP